MPLEKERKERIRRMLGGVSTGNVADAMDRLGLSPGVPQGLIPRGTTRGTTVGFAYPMKNEACSSEDSGAATRQNHVIDQLADPGDVVIIDTGDVVECCCGGGILAFRAYLRGLAGMITSGSFRDMDELSTLDLPIYSRALSPLKSAGRLKTVSINEDVTLCGVPVHPGDVVVMDETGVVIVPLEQADRVAPLAAEIRASEEKKISLLRLGLSLAEARSGKTAP